MNNQGVTRLIDKEIDPAFARRAKIIFEEAEKYWERSKKVKLLDVGCGRGWYEEGLKELFKNAEIWAIDQNEKYLSLAKKNHRNSKIKFLRANAQKLPFKNSFFDGVICSELLEHVDDDKAVLKEIFRVLKPGGKVMISVPSANYPMAWDPLNWWLEKIFHKHVPANIWWLAGIWADHVRLYKKQDLAKKLRERGFQIMRLTDSTKFCAPFAHFLLYGLGKNLVEAGWLKEFNRFNFQKETSLPMRMVKSFFDFWDKKNTTVESSADRGVNLVATAVK